MRVLLSKDFSADDARHLNRILDLYAVWQDVFAAAQENPRLAKAQRILEEHIDPTGAMFGWKP